MNSGIFNLCLVVIEKLGEGLNKVAISDLLAKRVSKFGEILGKCQSDLPRLVFSSSNKSPKSVNLVFFFVEILSHGNEALEAEHSNGVLFVLRQLSEEWKKLLNQVRLIELCRENANL